MENGQKSLQNLFDGRVIFNVPQYQRAYAWEERQLGEFLEDIRLQLPGKPYFFGTILLQERPADGVFNLLDIVDGQQRLTTVIIFMSQVLALLPQDHPDRDTYAETYIQYKSQFKLRVLADDNDFFKSYVLQDNHPPDGMQRTPSQRRLWDAKHFFLKRLQKCEMTELGVMLRTVEAMRVLTYAVGGAHEASLIFETTNDRGKDLTNLEKTKSFLMYKTSLCDDDPEPRLGDIQQRFTNIYRDHEAMGADLFEDSILQYHFIAFERWKSKRTDKQYVRPTDIVKSRVNAMIAEHDHPKALKFIDKYSLELRETFALVKSLLASKDRFIRDIYVLDRVARFYPLLIKTLKYDRIGGTHFSRVAHLVEIFSFRVFGIARKRSNAASEWLYTAARDFQGDFDSLVQRLKDKINEMCGDAVFRERLSSSFFYKEVYSRDRNYLFWRYENQLRRTVQPKVAELPYEDLLSDDPQTKFTIEHIAAQSSVIVADSSILPTDLESLSLYVHRLGNLTIDPSSANSSKGALDFESKNAGWFRKATLKTQTELADFVDLTTRKWDAGAIERRGNRIIDFAMNCWDFRPI